jgi:DNA polymerase III delta subunit
MVYLFIGQDSLSKDIKLNSLKQQLLNRRTEQFNLDIAYGDQLSKKELQEKLLFLPVAAQKRLIVLKQIGALKQDSRDFLMGYLKKPREDIILVLDAQEDNLRDSFIQQLKRCAKVSHFKETVRLNTFTLARYIELGKADYALSVLNQLLTDGERPERIIGGLRYNWERKTVSAYQKKRELRFLLECDLDIKTGRLKPNLALEKLVISLCCTAKPSG